MAYTPVQVYNRSWEQLSSLPTEISGYLAGGPEFCCRLHGPSSLNGLAEGGCANEALGTHPAIVAYHRDKNRVCHAPDGQLVLDRRCADGILNDTRDFRRFAWARSDAFVRKYMRGNKAPDSQYGKNYCHLRLMESGAKSRIARILGPESLVADAARFFLVFGHPDGKKVKIACVAPGRWHVSNGNEWMDYVQIARQLVSIAMNDPQARIGTDDLTALEKEVDMVEVDKTIVFHAMVCNVGILKSFPKTVVSETAFIAFGADDPARRNRLLDWFFRNGIEIDSVTARQMMLATLAPAAVKGAKAEDLKNLVKNWAIMGDVLLKMFAAARVVVERTPPSAYTKLLEAQTNVKLSELLVKSGLRGSCEVGLLSKTSKFNATMLEAMVGVMGYFSHSRDLDKFLTVLGLKTKGWRIAPDRDIETIKPIAFELSSNQYARVCQLLSEGQLGE